MHAPVARLRTIGLFLLLVGAPTTTFAQASLIDFGSVVGSLSPTAPKSTSEIIAASKSVSTALSGQRAFFFEADTETRSPLLYPQFGYGMTFLDDFLWEFKVLWDKTSETDRTFVSTNNDFLLERQRTDESEFKFALGYNFAAEHLVKVGWGWSWLNSPGEQLLIQGGSFGAYGPGSTDQSAQGPLAGLEFNFPLELFDTTDRIYFYTDLYYQLARGYLNFNSYAVGPNYTSVLDGSTSIEAHSVTAFVGFKFYVYEVYGIKLSYFFQRSFSRVINLDGYLYENNIFIPLVKPNPREIITGDFQGLYIGFTTKME